MTVFNVLNGTDFSDDYIIYVIESETSDVLYNDKYDNWTKNYDIQNIENREVISLRHSIMNKFIIFYV